MFRTLREASSEQWNESLGWLLYSLAGSTLPIWLGGYVLLPIFGRHFSWVEYGRHGEFALYSAALLAPTLRLIAKDISRIITKARTRDEEQTDKYNAMVKNLLENGYCSNCVDVVLKYAANNLWKD